MLDQLVRQPGPLPQLAQPVDTIKHPEYLHGINNADPLDPLCIVGAQKHGKDHTFFPVHPQLPFDPIQLIELHIVLEHSPIDMPPTKQKYIAVLSHDAIDQAGHLELGALGLGLVWSVDVGQAEVI